ncbi:MAG: hypothetical protein IPJ88_12640 [Myxococcales bacterium]|nr:MAG: hypothetical protein IPJ88_12640 [Myxococcales bacterium]
MAHLFFRVALVALIALPSVAQAQFFNPGKLSKYHNELDGDSQCNQCHASGKRISSRACLDCHVQLGQRIAKSAGLHGRKYRGKDCGSCHVEHLGRSTKLIQWPGGNRKRFQHNDAGWKLRGAHADLDCSKCHKKKTKAGSTTYLGLNTTCTSCHEDPHKSRFGSDCTSCHNEQKWSSVKVENFDHSRTRFSLRGKHQDVECKECHGQPAKYQGLKFSACNDCHSDPHKGRFRQSCTSCHTEQAWSDLHRVRANHPGVSIRNGHASVKCAECHDRGSDREPSKGSACVSCHSPVHEAKFGRNCKKCHASIEWLGLPEKTGLDAHGLTVFPLVGEHRSVSCKNCHNPRLPTEKRYRKLSYKHCNNCHDDPHKKAFYRWDKGLCESCHTENGFAPSNFDAGLHKKADFALDGMHVAVPCSNCHESKRPRYSFVLAKQQCMECHENPHGDQFEKEMADGGCAHCHSTQGWHQPKIDHSIWPLTGAHAQTACVLCHSPTKADQKSGKGASYRGVPRDCTGCHEDIHAGQFRLSEPLRECAFCHDTQDFVMKNFDHNKKTRYAITGKHKALKCDACHTENKLRNGEEVIWYRLGYAKCGDCHANPHKAHE